MKIRLIHASFSLSLAMLGSFALVSCGTTRVPVGDRRGIGETEQLNLGTHTFPISTVVPAAQGAFDRGLTLAYAFSHKAAEREFRRAADLDPGAAMPWWGVALVNGP